jgi:hypothetical protein
MTEDDKFNMRMCAKDIANQRRRPVRVILSDIHDAQSGLFESASYSKSGHRNSSAMCVGKTPRSWEST